MEGKGRKVKVILVLVPFHRNLFHLGSGILMIFLDAQNCSLSDGCFKPFKKVSVFFVVSFIRPERISFLLEPFFPIHFLIRLNFLTF